MDANSVGDCAENKAVLKKREKIARYEHVEPVFTYEDIMYKQTVTVKRYASNIPIMDMACMDDSFIVGKGLETSYAADPSKYVSSGSLPDSV